MHRRFASTTHRFVRGRPADGLEEIRQQFLTLTEPWDAQALCGIARDGSTAGTDSGHRPNDAPAVMQRAVDIFLGVPDPRYAAVAHEAMARLHRWRGALVSQQTSLGAALESLDEAAGAGADAGLDQARLRVHAAMAVSGLRQHGTTDLWLPALITEADDNNNNATKTSDGAPRVDAAAAAGSVQYHAERAAALAAQVGSVADRVLCDVIESAAKGDVVFATASAAPVDSDEAGVAQASALAAVTARWMQLLEEDQQQQQQQQQGGEAAAAAATNEDGKEANATVLTAGSLPIQVGWQVADALELIASPPAPPATVDSDASKQASATAVKPKKKKKLWVSSTEVPDKDDDDAAAAAAPAGGEATNSAEPPNAARQHLHRVEDALTAAMETGQASDVAWARAAPIRLLSRHYARARGDGIIAEALLTSLVDDLDRAHQAASGSLPVVEQPEGGGNGSSSGSSRSSNSNAGGGSGEEEAIYGLGGLACYGGVREELYAALQAKAALVEKMEWNGQKRGREADKLRERAAAVAATDAALSTASGDEGDAASSGDDRLPPHLGEVARLPAWWAGAAEAILDGGHGKSQEQ